MKTGAMKIAPVLLCAYEFETCIAMLYNAIVIRNFLHKGLKVFFETGSKAGIQPAHAARLRLQLARLETATAAEDMDLPGWRLHPLKGELKGHWAVWVDQN
jgi:toxin HigB-1